MARIRTFLTIRPRRNCVNDLAAFFETEKILDKATELGCVRTELLISHDVRDKLVVVADWTEAASFRRWLKSPIRSKWMPTFERLVESSSHEMFDILQASESDSD